MGPTRRCARPLTEPERVPELERMRRELRPRPAAVVPPAPRFVEAARSFVRLEHPQLSGRPVAAQQRKGLVVDRLAGSAAPLGRQHEQVPQPTRRDGRDWKSTRLNSSHTVISYAVFCLKKKKNKSANKRQNIKKISKKRKITLNN